jgi:hypothetical protein
VACLRRRRTKNGNLCAVGGVAGGLSSRRSSSRVSGKTAANLYLSGVQADVKTIATQAISDRSEANEWFSPRKVLSN